MLALMRLAAGLARQSARTAANRAARVSGLVLLALVFALIGLTCLAVALWIWLARIIDPALAALVMAGGAFVISAVLLLVARIPAPRRQSGGLDPAAQQLIADLRAGGGLIGVWAPLLLVALAGFLATGRKPPR